jgi:hypothetical protein
MHEDDEQVFNQLKLLYVGLHLIAGGDKDHELLLLNAFVLLVLENMFDTEEEVSAAIGVMGDNIRQTFDESRDEIRGSLS